MMPEGRVVALVRKAIKAMENLPEDRVMAQKLLLHVAQELLDATGRAGGKEDQ